MTTSWTTHGAVKAVGSALLGLLLSSCAGTLSHTPISKNEPLVKGPAVMDVVTPFDRALSCLDGRINKEQLRFAVGAILDATGKEQVTDGGAGKFVTQGAGDIVQSALFMAGATVVNRRDPRVIENDVRWGLLDPKKQAPTTFFITGSINSLDFLPGSGFDLQVAGVGPRYRQSRILVGLDLSLTDAVSGRIVANVPLQKQVVSTEDGFGIGRFFGTTLISADFGGKQREALNLVLRQMLNLATFELLTQVMNPARYGDCMAMVEVVDGVTDNSLSRRKLQQYLADQSKAAELAAKNPKPATAAGTPGAPEPSSTTDQAAARTATAASAVPANTAAAAPVASAGGAATSLSAPASQSPNYGEEQTSTSASALRALSIPPGAGGASEALMSAPVGSGSGANGSVSNASVLAAVAQAGPGQPAASNAVVAARAPAAAGCDFAPGAFPQVTPLLATQPASSLVVRSRTAQTLCLADAAGRMVPHALSAGASQRFDGQPPWKLWAERLQDIEFVFQGLPLRLPSYVKDRMELLERPLSAPTG